MNSMKAGPARAIRDMQGMALGEPCWLFLPLKHGAPEILSCAV